MNKDYAHNLQNLKRRRYDDTVKAPVLSESFHNKEYPQPILYALEAMKEVDHSFTYKLYSNFKRTEDLLTLNLANRGIEVDVRYHGAHSTETHIELYGDLELIVLPKKISSNPTKDIQLVTAEIIQILTNAQAYNLIDYSSKNRCLIQLRKPVANVSILPAIWMESELYEQKRLEINKAICEFNFDKKTKKVYLPFLNMARLNTRDRDTNGLIKSMIRLVRSLLADSNESIDFNYEEIVGLVYNLPFKDPKFSPNLYLSILPKFQAYLEFLIKEPQAVEKLLSPSKKELVFGKKQKQIALRQLRDEVALLTKDVKDGLKSINLSISEPIAY